MPNDCGAGARLGLAVLLANTPYFTTDTLGTSSRATDDCAPVIFTVSKAADEVIGWYKEILRYE